MEYNKRGISKKMEYVPESTKEAIRFKTSAGCHISFNFSSRAMRTRSSPSFISLIASWLFLVLSKFDVSSCRSNRFILSKTLRLTHRHHFYVNRLKILICVGDFFLVLRNYYEKGMQKGYSVAATHIQKSTVSGVVLVFMKPSILQKMFVYANWRRPSAHGLNKAVIINSKYL